MHSSLMVEDQINDASTDGKWCYTVFWVVGKPNTSSQIQSPRPPDVFLLKFCCYDQRGLLHDVTWVLSELELTIKKVKVSTTPDGKVMDLFFVTDSRELLHTKKRKDDTIDHLRSVIGDAMISCEIELVDSEVASCSQAAGFLPSIITEDMFQREMPLKPLDGLSTSENISYGRFSLRQRRSCEIDLFTMQADGKKIVDPSKQMALASRLEGDDGSGWVGFGVKFWESTFINSEILKPIPENRNRK
ncbi:hypothetical protein CRG98_027212 [Punica granatum]|uniref:ACT domain-containing protein ACR n=1 Tax=Punica granatum TaxID=22663 RepID=A0A2I0J846_PUNGR|nr:hypothetical protein CRG98_027212 [Punica granatum]